MTLHGKTLILGIGAQRCGTTWLHDYLSDNPQVFGSPIKELHFFDTHLEVQSRAGWQSRLQQQLDRLSRGSKMVKNGERVSALRDRLRMHDDPQTYFQYFADRAGDRSFVCEITPSYCLLNAEQFRWVRDLISSSGANAKIVFLMRDPIDRHLSFVRYRAELTGKRSDFAKTLINAQATARGRYDLTLENLRSVFPQDQIVTGFYENIFNDPDTHLRDLMNRLGLSYSSSGVGKKRNATTPTVAPLEQPELWAALSTFAPVYDYVNREFAGTKPATWRA
jgi:hypothetical protein